MKHNIPLSPARDVVLVAFPQTWKVFKHLPGFFLHLLLPSNETWKVLETFQVFPFVAAQTVSCGFIPP